MVNTTTPKQKIYIYIKIYIKKNKIKKKKLCTKATANNTTDDIHVHDSLQK